MAPVEHRDPTTGQKRLWNHRIGSNKQHGPTPQGGGRKLRNDHSSKLNDLISDETVETTSPKKRVLPSWHRRDTDALWTIVSSNKEALAAFERLEKGSRSPQDEKIIKAFLSNKKLTPETRGAPAALAGLMNPPPGKKEVLPSWSAEDIDHLFNIASNDENAKNALQRLFNGSRSLKDEQILKETIEKNEHDPYKKLYASSALEGLMIPPRRGKNPSINPSWNPRDANRLFDIVSTDQHAKEAYNRIATGGRDPQDEKLIRDFIDRFPKTPEQRHIFGGAHAALEGILHPPPGQGSINPPSWDSRDVDDLYSAASKYNASKEALERLTKGSRSREDERLVKLALKNEPSSGKISNAYAALEGIMIPPPNE